MYVKIKSMQLQFLKNNQSNIRLELYRGLQDARAARETSAENVARRTILPSSYIESPRDMHHRYQDVMALVPRVARNTKRQTSEGS
ncbi:hypothetical protein Sjap_003002 [Stephania japonica]|uniref:Helitron helicase-like domain-containing protein n=1 Tax=Stephania japonica TaxID=461633 RepID=A0AAP0KQ31_9MAGN